MQISSPVSNRTRKVALSAAFLCAALMLSLVENFVFPGGILPIPGAKPGLANAAILLCASFMGKRYAFGISLGRILLLFFLFGNGTSILYALSGGLLSFVGILIFSNSSKISFLGKSVICAILHNTAQLLCAAFIIGFSVIALLPWMVISAILCGGVTGVLLNFIYNPVYKYSKKFFKNT